MFTARSEWPRLQVEEGEWGVHRCSPRPREKERFAGDASPPGAGKRGGLKSVRMPHCHPEQGWSEDEEGPGARTRWKRKGSGERRRCWEEEEGAGRRREGPGKRDQEEEEGQKDREMEEGIGGPGGCRGPCRGGGGGTEQGRKWGPAPRAHPAPPLTLPQGPFLPQRWVPQDPQFHTGGH